jgi:hypothetical protein
MRRQYLRSIEWDSLLPFSPGIFLGGKEAMIDIFSYKIGIPSLPYALLDQITLINND